MQWCIAYLSYNQDILFYWNNNNTTYNTNDISSLTPISIPTLVHTSTQFNQIKILLENVELLLARLNENKHGVADGIPNILAKKIKESI